MGGADEEWRLNADCPDNVAGAAAHIECNGCVGLGGVFAELFRFL